jgi:hypothetical protein
MQSFRQYRQFRSLVEQQRYRATEKLNNAEGRRDPLTAPSMRDLEKGTAANESSPSLASQHLANVDANVPDHAQLRGSDDQQVQQPAQDDEDQEADKPNEIEEEDHDMRQYLSRLSTQRSKGEELGNVITGINIRKRRTQEGGEGNVFIVGFHDENDPMNPHRWSFASRIGMTLIIAGIGFVVGFASAIDSAALPQAAEEFGVSEVVESLATGRSIRCWFESCLLISSVQGYSSSDSVLGRCFQDPSRRL